MSKNSLRGLGNVILEVIVSLISLLANMELKEKDPTIILFYLIVILNILALAGLLAITTLVMSLEPPSHIH